jgi:hypothetical protein
MSSIEACRTEALGGHVAAFTTSGCLFGRLLLSIIKAAKFGLSPKEHLFHFSSS